MAVRQRVNAGSTLLALAAIKTQTHVTADRQVELETVPGVAGEGGTGIDQLH